MELEKIINNLNLLREENSYKMGELKNNINCSYELAKLDFTTISNYEDSIETFDKIIVELSNLQKRIVERNKK
jgi:hypothetical protein